MTFRPKTLEEAADAAGLSVEEMIKMAKSIFGDEPIIVGDETDMMAVEGPNEGSIITMASWALSGDGSPKEVDLVKVGIICCIGLVKYAPEYLAGIATDFFKKYPEEELEQIEFGIRNMIEDIEGAKNNTHVLLKEIYERLK